jgi:hypothetical protein
LGRVRPSPAEPQRVSQQELQEDVQRFVGQLIERTGQAALEVGAAGPPDALSTEAIRRAINYETAALDIATEPSPEVSVLDMVVFLRLCSDVLAHHWIPSVFGERGRPFLAAFEQATQDFWPVAQKVLSTSQKEALVRRIDEWRSAHGDLVQVELVRLTDFSDRASPIGIARAREMGGLLAGVKAATRTADQATLLAERALFLANRLPFLIRHQVRLGSREIVSDSMALLGSTESLVENTRKLEPVMGELRAAIASGVEAAREGRMLVKEVEPLVPTPVELARVERVLDTTNDLVANTSALLGKLLGSARRLDAVLSRAVGYLVVLGAAWSFVWWSGYAFAKGRRRRS